MAVRQAVSNALGDALAAWSAAVDRDLERRLGDRLDCPPRLREAMRYSVFAGGKRLRPLLVLLANEACLGAADAAMPAAAAVEMIHTYSLIHDDLPAMDDDDLRRGLPTCHRNFDEATAILAGDALLTLAFEAVSEMQPSPVAARCVKELAKAAGAVGMVGGQVDDLHADAGPGTLEWLESLHERKTGALLRASLRMGGIAAGASLEQLDALTDYGRQIGLAFQIVDDLLDVEGDAVKLGKDVRKDEAAGKLTYPGLLGVEESRRRAWELMDAARAALAPFGPAGVQLARLAQYIVERDR
jgi:geranylgeranyl diphosphate synthase, type II